MDRRDSLTLDVPSRSQGAAISRERCIVVLGRTCSKFDKIEKVTAVSVHNRLSSFNTLARCSLHIQPRSRLLPNLGWRSFRLGPSGLDSGPRQATYHFAVHELATTFSVISIFSDPSCDTHRHDLTRQLLAALEQVARSK